MIIKNISLENFRNIQLQKVEFGNNINILCGDNAQGKTNIIEAIYYFAYGKSFRSIKDRELITFDKNDGRIFAEIDNGKKELFIDIKLSKQNSKEININRIKIQKMSEFLGNFRAVLFTPEHLNLIKGGPGERRSFIDSAICQIKPRFVSLLYEYTKVLEQRNALLKSLKQQNLENDDTMEYWNEKLSEDASKIIFQRRKYVERIQDHGEKFYSEFSLSREMMNVKYNSLPNEIKTEEDICFFINKKLTEGIENDIKNGATMIGPHRDDLIIEIDKKAAKIFASQGQQRSAVLALKLAEGEISKEESGEYPVFLFDDILSELDLSRQEYILKKIENKQVFITGCIDYFFDEVEDAERIYVESGVYRK